MKIVRSNIIPFKGFRAVNLFGVLFARHETFISESLLNHEEIHTAQMKELLYLPFYIIYFMEWLIRLFLPGNAYRNISFEQEAYNNQHCKHYLKIRDKYAQWK